MPVQKTLLTEDSGGILEDKLQTGRTGGLSEKDSGNVKHRPQARER